MSLVDTVSPSVVRGGLVLVPVGSVEQHGPHLPLDTDTVIATAVAEGLAPLVGAVVAPPVAYGASGEHQSFAGTISIGSAALTQTLIEIGRSLTEWAARVLFVNGHGGNASALRRAVHQLQSEGREAAGVPCAPSPGGVAPDAHAGRTETSLMLHLAPSRVHLSAAAAGNTTPAAQLMPAMLVGGVASVSPNGVLGDPSGASADEGRELLRCMVVAAHKRIVYAVRR